MGSPSRRSSRLKSQGTLRRQIHLRFQPPRGACRRISIRRLRCTYETPANTIHLDIIIYPTVATENGYVAHSHKMGAPGLVLCRIGVGQTAERSSTGTPS